MEVFMRMFNHLIVILFTVLIPATIFSQSPSTHVVYDGKKLTMGYDIGVDSSERMHNWFKDMGNELVMTYPRGQTWGAVFITVGKAKGSPQERQFKNFSNFKTLIISMKGAKGGENVDIGIKDRTDPDDGSETKKTVTLTNTYSEYRFALDEFRTANLQYLYVVTEFVFGENSPCTVFVNSIKFQ
jgi:hypothetical protein